MLAKKANQPLGINRSETDLVLMACFLLLRLCYDLLFGICLCELFKCWPVNLCFHQDIIACLTDMNDVLEVAGIACGKVQFRVNRHFVDFLSTSLFLCFLCEIVGQLLPKHSESVKFSFIDSIKQTFNLNFSVFVLDAISLQDGKNFVQRALYDFQWHVTHVALYNAEHLLVDQPSFL